MKKYVAKDFVDALSKKTLGRNIPACPFCGGLKFTTTEQLASIIIGEDIDGLNLGPSIPSGMIICENCGHIELFALGALGMLNKREATKNGD